MDLGEDREEDLIEDGQERVWFLKIETSLVRASHPRKIEVGENRKMRGKVEVVTSEDI